MHAQKVTADKINCYQRQEDIVHAAYVYCHKRRSQEEHKYKHVIQRHAHV